jgi:RNA polymerase sigma factor (TIGR02999 family)
MSDLTQILNAIEAGDKSAADRLLPVVYAELRQLAALQLARERPGQTLDATALVHEAYLRLLPDEPGGGWQNRRHYYAAAAEAMRRILIENARRKRSVKHGGEHRRVALSDQAASSADENLLDLDEALTRLAAEDPIAGKVVELRHFAGLGHEEIAVALGITVYLARQKWTYARAWLRNALEAP